MKILACLLPVLLGTASVVSAADAYVEGEVLVTFKPGVAEQDATTTVNGKSARFTKRFQRIGKHSNRVSGVIQQDGKTTAELIQEFSADPQVESVEPDYIRHVTALGDDDPQFSQLWGLENTGQTVNGTTGTAGVDIEFQSAWALAKPDSDEVVVAVIDTGVDITHPDLADNIWTNPGEIAGNGIDDDGNGYIDDVHGYDFASKTATITDSGEHGTHVAGTIGATGNNEIGVIGVDYKTKILPLKVSTDGDTMQTSAVMSAINYVIALKESGVNIVAVNASYGGSSFSNSEYTSIKALRDAGIVICAAAGNDGTNNDSSPLYPASYDSSNVIAVAALSQTNGLASFSNYGATSVDIAAPGVNIKSTMPLSLTSVSISFTANDEEIDASQLEYSETTDSAGVSGTLVDCGIGNTSEFPTSVAGNIALIQRGTLTFATKVSNAKAAGAIAAIIYDNTDESLSESAGWTLGAEGDWLPALQITKASGEALLATLPTTATVVISSNTDDAYQFLSGTSMATPFLTAAVAFSARNFPEESMSEHIARILNNTTPVTALSGKIVTGGRLDLLKIVDTDSDGLPDWWETEHFGDLAQTSSDDPDNDGYTNLEEFTADTDPTDATDSPTSGTTQSLLAIDSVSTTTDSTGSHFTMTFNTEVGYTYEVEWSETLETGSWQTLGDPITGTGSAVQVSDPDDMADVPKRFYRVVQSE
ncbi:S8 family serine peptidase [Luteolibacter pohnpeiensis]|uniref:S8 family serine peptidase n=1 Tax=Luteolibacter pohnpeiensis TaxID=454153 RepID=A0A934VTE6_9BACT|nr:S8 family serine peptidase [Luteolibacter pohnpeiensis]MBK1881407.1 S8 family serine peptidase [Luteolibacter pohnpeiensis]